MDERRQGQAWGDPQPSPFAGTSDGTGNGQDQPTPLDYGANGPDSSDPNGTGTPGTANYNPGAADNSGDQTAAPPPDNSGATANNGGDQTPPPSDTADNSPPPSNTSAAPPPSDTADNSPPPSDTADNSPPPSDTGTDTADNSPPPTNNTGPDTTDNSGDGTTNGNDSGGVTDGIMQTAGGLVGDVVDTTGGLITGATDATTGLLDNVVTTADNLLGDVIGAVGSIAGNGTGGVGGLVDGAVGAADGLVTQVVDTADGLLTSTVSTIDGLAVNGADGGNGLLGDIVHTADGLVTGATDAVGLGGDGLLGDATSGIGDLGGVTGTGGLIDDAVAVVNSPLNGDVSADSGPNGSDANIIANLTDDGSVGNLVNDAGNILTTNLGDTGLTNGSGPIASASVLPEGNGIVDNGAVATVNDPSASGPIVDVDAISDGQNGSSQNLINLGALDQGTSPNILANVFTDGDASNANVTGNVIDVGPNGQNLADANVLTSPDQFQFTSLDGTGADSLVGSLTDVAGTTTGDSLPAVTAPALDLTGDHSIIDVSLNGDADTDHSGILAPLQQAHPLGIV